MTTATEPKVNTRRCSRCRGTGMWRPLKVCLRCNGTGETVIVTTAERAAAKAASDRRYAALLQVQAGAAKRDGHRNGSVAYDANWGFRLLEEREPQRFAACLASIEAGRLDHVIDALIAYLHANQNGA